eukprot:TRINITY_DN7627_c0_g2_i1.p1 TRINITY_DN7627_c0_g2~~TRINITY_DN7627_c0_g2_i1.p1  ORF type:complete len:245 (-),score=44.07 TRINITY_DN7627_c0_g2_i1:36-770(-)
MLSLYKMYIDSINKQINVLVSLEYERPHSIKALLDSLDHGLFNWGQLVSNASQEPGKKSLEEYLRQILLTAISKALYYKRTGSSYTAIEVLEESRELLFELLNSKCSGTLHICCRFILSLGLIYLESARTKKALEIFLEAVKVLGAELKILLEPVNYFMQIASSRKLMHKIRRNLSFLNLSIYNMGLAYSMERQHKEVLECHNMCRWCYRTERTIFAQATPTNAQRFIIAVSYTHLTLPTICSV